MRITSRRRAIAFSLTLGICLIALAVTLNIGWIILNWREGVLLFLGAIFFLLIIAGLVLNTIFLVREIRRNEQHDSFINAVTHELKTPIASIRLYLETLQRREVDRAKQQEFYRLMLQDTDRLHSTVEQVLKAGQAGHKRGKHLEVAVDFAGLVRECVDTTRTRYHLDETALRFDENGSGAASRIMGDPEELRTAVINILDNAVKYSPQQVAILAELAVPDDQHIALRVRDQGIGIPAQDLKRVFKRFYRVRDRALSEVKGTGLGLFIVRSIAQKHGGRVFAESEGAGKGSTITIELPRSVA
jgi:two-component system, OmpR family, sensor histidine kinase SenX3